MKIGLSGYGQMGSITREIALKKGYKIEAIIDPSSKSEHVTHNVIGSFLPQIDVMIDFSDPAHAVGNIEKYVEYGISAVIGTTGWYDRLDYVSMLVKQSKIGLIWSGNFSLGVNIYFSLVKKAAALFNRFDQYDVAVHESHHRMKSDSPSGTAKMLGDILINEIDRKKKVTPGSLENQNGRDELCISSTRCGAIPGEHQVLFDSDVDTITFTHNARSRFGFAEGALAAAKWIATRKGFYHIDDMMESIIGVDHY